MNSILQIQIRVIARDAQAQIAALQAQVRGLEARLRRLNASMSSTTAASGGMAGALTKIGGGFISAGNGLARFSGFLGTIGSNIIKFGKNIQWTGRQLEYRFTLPVLAAGYLVTKMVIENEKAMTRLRKVYGSSSMSTKQMVADTKQLEQAFYALSNIFGKSMKEVTSIGAFWAQAGATGITLAKATRATIKTMILGEMEAEDAATSLIAVMTQYGLSTDQLRLSLAQLNTTENETAVSFKDLIDVVTRAGGTARTSGVDIRHLAAMTAALVPAAGTAEMAGTGLKTMLARIMAPTGRAAEALGFLSDRLGTDITDSSNSATKRLELLSKAFEGLTPAQRAVTAEMIAGKWQINRFDTLLRDIANPLGNYQKILNATSDDTKVLATYQRELGIYLSSTPQAFAILKTQMQNMLAQVMVPLMPAILGIVSRIKDMVHWFTSLSPRIQQTVILGFLLLAVLGPIISYLGAFTIVGGMVVKSLIFIGQGFMLVGSLALKSVGYIFKFGSAIITMVKNVIPFLASLIQWFLEIAIQAAYFASRWVIAFGQIVATTIIAWARIIIANAGGWAQTILTHVIGWAQTAALHVIGWGQIVATTVIGWARSIAATVAGWAKTIAIWASYWATQIAMQVTYYAALLVETASYWAYHIATTVSGWAATVAMWASHFAKLLVLQAFYFIELAIAAVTYWSNHAIITAAGWAASIAVWVANAANELAIAALHYLGLELYQVRYWMRVAAINVTMWARVAAITVTGWARVAAITIAGWATQLRMTVTFWAAQIRVAVARWALMIRLTISRWAQQIAITVSGWAQTVAIAVSGWAQTVTLAVRGWAQTIALTVSGWAHSISLAVSGWAYTVTLAVRGWASSIALTVSGWAQTVFIAVAGWANTIALNVSGWAFTVGLTIRSWATTTGIWALGWARKIALDVRGWATSIALSIKGWVRVYLAGVIGWTRNLVLTVTGWAKTIAITISGWATMAATTVIGWARTVAANIAGWAAKLAVTVAGWARTIALTVAGWWALLMRDFAAIAKSIAAWIGGWVARIAITVAGWAKVIAINVLGWMGIESAAVTGGAALVVAAGIALFMLRDQVGKVFSWIKDYILKAWHALPAGIQAAFTSVFRILQSAMKTVTKWLSYLNPFARHSPSLVEQVTKGVDLIAKKYASLSNVGSVFRKAIDDLRAFKDATQDAVNAQEAAKFGEMRTATVTASPGSGAAFDAAYASMRNLQAQLGPLQAEIDLQATIVGNWSAELETAKTALDEASNALSVLKDNAEALKNSLDEAEANMKRFAEAPITGMKAMNEAIWQNEYAQNQLNLQLKLMEQQGVSIDKIKDKMSNLQGEIENVMANRQELRLAGAGSDVLSTLDAQIAQMQASKAALSGEAQQVQGIVDQLDKLNLEGEILKLQQSVTFDPLLHQIDLLMDKQQEMNFDEIVAGVRKYSAEMDVLSAQYEQATSAVAAQQSVVDALKARHDLISAAYDAEKAKLDELTDAYSAIEQQINDITNALEQFSLTAKSAGGGAGGADGLGIGDLTGVYDIPGGAGSGILNEQGDIGKLAEQWAKEAEKSFGSFDLFKPLRQQWNKWIDKAKGWWKDLGQWLRDHIPHIDLGDKIGLNKDTLGKSLTGALTGFAFGGAFGAAIGGLIPIIAEVFKDNPIVKWISDTIDTIWTELKRAFGIINKELKKWGKLWDPFVEAVGHVWNVIKVILGFILAIFSYVWPTIKSILVATWRAIVDVVKGALEFVRGIIEIVLGIINGDWGQIWDGIKTVFAGVWDAIVGILRFALQVVWETIKFVLGLVWDIVKSALYAVFDVFRDVFVGIWHFIQDVWDGIWNTIKTVASAIWDFIKWVFGGIKNTVTGVFDSVVGFFTSLPGRIMGAIDAIASAAAGVGKAIWNGITGGLSAAGGFIADVASGVWNGVKGFLNDKVFDPIRGFKVSFFGHDFKPFGSLPRLAQGGIVGAVAGGQMALLGEAGRREAVMPLPSGFSLSSLAATMTRLEKMTSAMTAPSSSNAKSEIHFHGDLSFPNIKSGEDAEAFIRNLESLAE